MGGSEKGISKRGARREDELLAFEGLKRKFVSRRKAGYAIVALVLDRPLQAYSLSSRRSA